MLEGVIVGVIVALAALHAARRLLPRSWFGRRSATLAAAPSASGCRAGCGTCGGCGSGGMVAARPIAKPISRG